MKDMLNLRGDEIPVPVALPTVGRSAELAELTMCLNRAAAGHGGLVLLAGEAGIGKSSLLDVLFADSGAALSVIGRCPGPGEAPPYGPWLDLVFRLGRTAGLNPATLPPPFGQATNERGGPYAQAVALEWWLGETPRPLLLAIEDLHWADSPSLDLLRHLAPRLRELPVLVVATYRSDEVHRTHPLWALLPDLQRHGALRLDLGRLSPADVAELTCAALPDLCESANVAARLHERTGGHTLFVRDLLMAATRDSAVLQEGHPLPETVQQAIDLRINRLPESALATLQAAAVVGERFGFALLARVAEASEDDLLGALEAALAQRIIRPLDDGGEQFLFDHALVREALLGRLIGPRRRRWHARVAEALLAEPNPDVEAVALHLYRAGDQRAVSYLIDAANRASGMFLLAQAGERYERALELLPESDPRWAEVLARLGLNLSHAAPDRARTCMQDALRVAEANGDRTLAAYVRHLMMGAPNGYCASLADMERLEAEEEAVRHDPRFWKLFGHGWTEDPGFPRISPHFAEALIWNGRPTEGRARWAELCAVAATDGHGGLPPAEIEFAYLFGELAAALRRVEANVTASEQSGQVIWQTGASKDRMFLWLFYNAARPDEVDAAVRDCERKVIDGDRRTGYPYLPEGYSALGPYQFLRGDWDQAAHNLVGYLQSGSRPWGTVREIAPWALWLLIERGELNAGSAIANLIQPMTPDGDVFWAEPMAGRFVKTLLAVRLGEPEQARAWLEGTSRWLAALPDYPLQSLHWTAWAEYYRTVEPDPVRAGEMAARALASAQRFGVALAEIRARRVLGEVAAAAGRLTEAEEHLQAGMALAEHCRFPYELALCRLSAGRVLGRRDLLEAARAELDRLKAQPALRAAEAALAGLRPVEGALPFGLTEREAEVIRLVAQGLTDREVGERLFISRRTVDGHLRNIFNKVGVSNRSALSVLAARHGLLQQ